MRLVTYLDRGEISRRSHPKAEGREKTGKEKFEYKYCNSWNSDRSRKASSAKDGELILITM